MEVPLKMIDCENYQCVPLSVPSVGSAHPTAVLNSSKRPNLLLFRNSKACIEFIYSQNEFLIWGRTNSCNNLSNLSDYKTLTIEDGLDFGLWCKFGLSLDQQKPLDAFIMIKNSLLTAISFNGEYFQSKLTVVPKSVWSTSSFGLIVECKDVVCTSASLPSLYNLSHPCEELVPIICAFANENVEAVQISEFNSSMKSCIVASIASMDILITHDTKRGHRFWLVRKATDGEKEEFYHQRELKAFEVNITKARENAKTPGFHLDKNNSVFSPILKSAFHTQQKFRSPFSEKQSPMFRRSCRLTSQPLFQSSPFVNSTMSEAAHSTTQLSRNSHFLPWFEMPLTPNLCLELIANEASLSTKHTSKFVASKAFATHDFNAQQYVCLLIGQIESLVLFRVCTKLSKRNMEITKCGNISCVDAINVEKLPYMAILEKDSTVTLYSGTLRLCKVRCPDPLLATSLNIDGAVNRNNPGNSILNFHASLGRTVIANTFGVTNIVCLTLPKLFENPSVEMFLNSFKCCLTPPDFTQIALDWFVCRNAVGKTVDSQCEFSLFIAFVENEIGLNDCENGRRSRSIDSCSDSGSKKVKMTEFGTEKDFADMFETDYATNLALICGFEELTEVSGVDREKEVQISTAKLDKNFELVIKIAHVIYEELKLDASKELESRILAIFLASVAHKLEFNNWKMRYFVDFPAAIFPSYLLKNDQNVSSTAKKPAASVEANIDSHHAKANFPELQKFFSDNKTMCFLDWVQAVMNLGNISPGDFNETKKGKRIAGGTVGAEMDWKSTLAEQGTLNLNASSLITLPCIWGVTERLCKSAIVYIFYVCFNNSLPSLQIECELLSSVKGFLSQVLIDLAGREIPVDLVEKLDLLKLRASGKTERSPSEDKITVGREHLPAQEGTGSEENEEKFCEQILFLMIRLKIDSDFIHTLPPGIALPLFDVVHQCHLKPSLNWPKEAINLIKRQDLITQKEMLARAADLEVKGKTTWSAWSICPKLGTAKYYTKQENNAGLTSANRTSAGQNTSTNGLEMNLEVLDFLFPNDCRIQSVKRMLNSSQPVKIKAHHQQNDLQVKLAHYAKRTMALPVGRGMFALSSVAPCITSTEPIPEMNFSCKVMPKNVSVQITSSTLSFPARSWAFYHNGVATGLRIDQNIKDLDSAWVIYNRPKSTNSGENASAHAGFLLGLALNGHLDNMSTFNFHSYLCRNQEQTSISLLLGLCASKQATRDEVLFRTITLHIGALLPPNGAELDVGFNVQTAALLAAGFLFMSSGDKHMADVMLNQINRPPGPELENCINRESFSLAAGLSLGMIMLGKGRSLFGLRSGASFTSQLCSYIKGGANPHVNSQFTCDQIREGENINLLVTSPGASLATGLIFFNTCSRSIADWFTPPETALTIDTILPEHLLLHVVAKALVCWEEILFTSEWVGNNLPEFLKSVFARGIYSQEEFEDENLDFSCWQAYCNIIAGSCFSIGLRFAGSQNKGAFTLVFKFLEVFLILFESGKGFDANTGARTVFTCLQTCLTALCMIMSGSGNLQVLAIIRRLHCLVGPNIDYGQQMAVHMSLGLLFLSGCRYSLRNDPKAIAALLAAFYPTYPISSDDNRYHLQAFRHLYVKACEPRLLLTRNVLNYKVEQALVKIVLKETKHYNEYEFETVTPCLVPQLDLISRIEVVNRYPNFQFLSIQTVLDDEKSRIDFAWILKSCLFVQSQSNETNYAYDTSFVKTKPPGFNSVTTFNLLRVNQNKQLFKIDSCNLDPAGCGLLRSTEDTFVGAFMESFKLSVESVNQSITSLLDLNVKTSLELLTIFAEIANNNTNMPQGHDKDFAENHGTSINSSILTKSEEKSIIVRSESCLQNTKAVIKQLTLFRLFHELSPLNSLFPKKDPIDKSAKVSVGTSGKKPIKSGFVEQYSWLSCLTATISVKLIQQFHNCLHDDNSSVKKYLTNPSSLKGSEEEPPRAMTSATVEPLPNVRPKSARLRNNSALLHKTSDAKPSGGLAESNLKPYLIKNSLTESQSDRNLSKLEDLHKSVSIKFDLSELNTLTNLLSILGISSPQIMRAAILGSLSTAEKEKSVERILKNDCGLFETVVQFRDRVVEQQGKIALTSTNQPGYNCESGGVGSDGGGNTKNTSSAVFSGYSVSCNSEIEKLLPPTPTQPLQQSDNFIQFDHILSSILSVSKGNGIKTTTRKNFDSNTKQNCFGGAFASLSDHQISLLLHTLCSVSVSSQLKKDLSQLTSNIMAQTYLKSAIKMLPISIILISVPPLPSINALDAFEIEYSKFNFANIELILDPASMFNINISTVEIEKEGKYGFESKLATFQGKLCIPKYEYSGFKDGCSSGDYSVCKKHKKLVAMVPRAECDLYEMAEYARQQSVLGLIIVETSATTEAADLKEYDQSPHKFSTYKTTSLDHSFIRENTRKREAGIPFILCTKTMGTDLQAFVKNGSQFIIKVSDGGIHGTELRVPSSSLLLVFVAFIVLTIISMIWLIFYYVQRFRYHHHQDRVIGQVRKATKKAFRMMPTKILREGDPELEAAFGRCAICLEAYKLWDMVRELPCSHIYHKSCVDAWLSRKPACPHCKSNVLKALGFDADYDWTCLDANSEPDAISLLDIVPQVVSVQIFAPNTAAPSRFITELTSIPHNPPANTGDQATALGSSSASAPSSPNQSNYRANNKQQPSTNNQQSNKRNSSSANDNGNNGNQGVTVRTTVSTTTAVATVEMSATSPQITASAKPPAARPKNKASKSGPGSNSVPATGGVGGGVGNRGGTSESSTPMNVALEVETHNHGPSSTSSGSTGAGGTAVSKTSPPLTLSSSGPSSNTSANSAASAAGKSRKRNKKATLSKKAISGDSKA